MLKVFEEVQKNVKFARKLAIIDNLAFRAHYKFTFAALLACTIMVSSQQYIGEHIRCIADKGVNEKVINTFCFFTTTFTVVRHLNSSQDAGGMAPHPGVGPMMPDEPIIRHAYYQWVPFVLFGQALLFYLPHFIWKRIEGGRIKSMASGFERAALASRDTPHTLDEKAKIVVPSRQDFEGKVSKVRASFLERLHINRVWALGLITCEVLNLLNVVMQVWIMDAFLGGQFIGLGELATGDGPDDLLHPMDVIFPKVTKCTFHKYGPSGSIQQHDALCVMALNVVNEKIYVFLWFWFIILFAITVLALLFRLASFILHSRSMAFNVWISKYVCAVPLDPISMQTVMQECYFSDWLILHYLALSMDGFVFKELYDGLAMDIEESRKNGSFRSAPKQDNGWEEDEKEPLKME